MAYALRSNGEAPFAAGLTYKRRKRRPTSSADRDTSTKTVKRVRFDPAQEILFRKQEARLSADRLKVKRSYESLSEHCKERVLPALFKTLNSLNFRFNRLFKQYNKGLVDITPAILAQRLELTATIQKLSDEHDHPFIKLNLARCYKKTGELSKAKTLLQRCKESCPNESEFYLQLIDICILESNDVSCSEAKKERLDEATALLKVSRPLCLAKWDKKQYKNRKSMILKAYKHLPISEQVLDLL